MRRTGCFLILLLLACHARAPERTSSPDERPPTQASAPPAATEPALPQPGEVAPELALRTIDSATVTLAEARADGPVVLVFGSFT